MFGHSVPGRPPQPSTSTYGKSSATTTSATSNSSQSPAHCLAPGNVKVAVAAATQGQLPITVSIDHRPQPVMLVGEEGDQTKLVCLSPAKPLVKPSTLADTYFSLPRSDSCTGDHGLHTFRDKKLPNCEFLLMENKDFTTDYFVNLHKITVSPGPHYAAGTPNFMGARIPLRHSKLNLERWRHHLVGYESPELCQFLEFGFPIGLYDDPKPKLSSTMRNHRFCLAVLYTYR